MWFNLWNVGFWMKPKNPKKNLSQLSREGNLTTNSSHITESSFMHMITTEQNKNSALAVQFLVHFFSRHETNTTWNFTFIKEVNTSRRLSFPFSELTWRRTILFAASERVNGGDRKREFLSVAKQTPYFRSILFITITKFSNLIGYQLSWFQQSRSV